MRHGLLCRALLVAALAAAAVRGVHPQTAREAPPLQSGIDVVMVTATVIDADGHYVTGLPRDAFTIWEDGVAQTISVFTSERVPVSLGVLLDVSDSMFGQRIVDSRAAVERFLFTLLGPTDEFSITAFNHAPRTLTPWTTTPSVISEALNGIRPSGGTALYDAVVNALPQMNRRTRQRAAILLLSDGADTASDATLRDVRSALLRSDAHVYAVAIDSPRSAAINTRVNAAALNEITGESGGRTEVVQDAAGLAAATTRIAEELNSQYVLGYSSPRSTDGKFHSIRVSAGPAGRRVRARNGYVGVPGSKIR